MAPPVSLQEYSCRLIACWIVTLGLIAICTGLTLQAVMMLLSVVGCDAAGCAATPAWIVKCCKALCLMPEMHVSSSALGLQPYALSAELVF